MKIEAVITCVNYADFLTHTLPAVKNHFDKMVVVTDTKDQRTKDLCEYYYVECVQTDAFYGEDEKFNKGRGINEGLKKLDMDGWVVHMDADIYLPPLTRTILERIDLDPACIYGVDRMMCPDYKTWHKFISNPRMLHRGWCYVYTDTFPMGVRIAEYMGSGYEPIGFFQMWNPAGSFVYSYPPNHGAADRSDVLHAKKWPRRKRVLIPEIVAVHLDSENLSIMGKNWNGRKTQPFGYDFEKKSWIQRLFE